jgi:hypothetical protein
MSRSLEQLKAKILSKAGVTDPLTFIFDVHEMFIKEYGWVPLEEFRQIPAETLFNLLGAAERRMQRERKRIKKMRKPRKR